MDEKIPRTVERNGDESECAADLEPILEWARLTACHVRRNIDGIETCRGHLKARGETDQRLRAFASWRESSAFTEREKAALSLSESMSLRQSEEFSQSVLKEAKRHFNRTEMVSLTLSLLAVNDWINAHANSPVRILVVEDEPLDQELLRSQLQKAQMNDTVIFASDADQALTVLEDYRSGRREGELIALFLDLILPGMSGIELLRQVRAMPDMEDLPVIVMTSSRDPRHREECEKLKVVSYVEKPVTFGSFSKAVANIFHQAKAA